jgi:hypothetical protein
MLFTLGLLFDFDQFSRGKHGLTPSIITRPRSGLMILAVGFNPRIGVIILRSN